MKEHLTRQTLFPSRERCWREKDEEKRERKEEEGQKGEERNFLHI